MVEYSTYTKINCRKSTTWLKYRVLQKNECERMNYEYCTQFLQNNQCNMVAGVYCGLCITGTMKAFMLSLSNALNVTVTVEGLVCINRDADV